MLGKCKYFYLWYGNKKSLFWNYYTIYQPKSSLLKFLKFCLRYIENLIEMVKILYFKILGYHIVLDRHTRYEAIEKYGTIVPKVLSFPYKYFFVWTDHMVLLYEDPDIILSRKKKNKARNKRLLSLDKKIFTRWGH